MSSGPRRRASLRLRPLGHAPPTPPEGGDRHGLVVSARTPVEAAHGTLRDALRDLCERCDGALPGADGDPPGAPAATEHDAPESDRRADEGGPLGRPHAGDHPLLAADRGAWEEHAFGRDRVNEAVAAYARALRRDRVELPAALAAVRATLVGDALRLRPAVFAAMQREAVRCCLEAFYAH
jgi:hypothetical protein